MNDTPSLKRPLYITSGAITAVAGVLILALLFTKINAEITRLNVVIDNPGAPRPLFFQNTAFLHADPEPHLDNKNIALAIFDGRFANENKANANGFIIGCKFTKQEFSESWHKDGKFNQTIYISESGGKNIISANITDLCPKGSFEKFVSEDKKAKIEGFKPGNVVLVIGYYDHERRLISNARHYGGTALEYRDSLKQTRMTIVFISLLFLISGVLVLYRNLKTQKRP